MRGKRIPLLLFLILFIGCSSDSSLKQTQSYRDPITYSFEAYTPYIPEQDPLYQFLTQTRETARQIREWEKKNLW